MVRFAVARLLALGIEVGQAFLGDAPLHELVVPVAAAPSEQAAFEQPAGCYRDGDRVQRMERVAVVDEVVADLLDRPVVDLVVRLAGKDGEYGVLQRTQRPHALDALIRAIVAFRAWLREACGLVDMEVNACVPFGHKHDFTQRSKVLGHAMFLSIKERVFVPVNIRRCYIRLYHFKCKKSITPRIMDGYN